MKFLIFLAITILLSVGCGGPKSDIHSVAREQKAYETASVESMDQAALILHLNLLSDEMSLATRNEIYSEMHHIEIALTKALVTLETNIAPSSNSIIDTLKIIALKIHEAGHDQNKSMATKLDKTLRDQIDKLQKAIAADT